MSKAITRRRVSRLALLLAICILGLAVLLAQRLWLSPEAREARYSRMTLEKLNHAAAGSRDPLLFYYLARRRSEVGDAPGSIEALQQALRLDPKFTRARATLGTVLLAADQDEQALQNLRQAIQDDPADIDGYLGLALLYRRHENWRLEEQASAAALQVDPRSADAWLLRGEAAQRQRNYAGAARCFDQAAAAGGGARALSHAAGARLLLGDFDRAEQQARAAVRADAKSSAAHLALGQVLLRKGRAALPEACAELEQALALEEPTGQANVDLGTAYQRQGRLTDAEQQFRFALRADPAQNAARYGLARVLRAQGRAAEAAAVNREFNRWTRFEARRVVLNDRVARDPGDPAAWFALARLYAQMHLWAEARRTTLSGLRRAPEHPQGLKLLQDLERHAH